MERKLGEVEPEPRVPGHPWGILAGESSRLKSKSDSSMRGLGTGLLRAEICGLGVADRRVGCKVRAGGCREEMAAYDEDRLCLCL